MRSLLPPLLKKSLRRFLCRSISVAVLRMVWTSHFDRRFRWLCRVFLTALLATAHEDAIHSPELWRSGWRFICTGRSFALVRLRRCLRLLFAAPREPHSGPLLRCCCGRRTLSSCFGCFGLFCLERFLLTVEEVVQLAPLGFALIFRKSWPLQFHLEDDRKALICRMYSSITSLPPTAFTGCSVKHYKRKKKSGVRGLLRPELAEEGRKSWSQERKKKKKQTRLTVGYTNVFSFPHGATRDDV